MPCHHVITFDFEITDSYGYFTLNVSLNKILNFRQHRFFEKGQKPPSVCEAMIERSIA